LSIETSNTCPSIPSVSSRKTSKPLIIVSIGVIYCFGITLTRAGIVMPVTTKLGMIQFTAILWAFLKVGPSALVRPIIYSVSSV
jgi:hypothetical protein